MIVTNIDTNVASFFYTHTSTRAFTSKWNFGDTKKHTIANASTQSNTETHTDTNKHTHSAETKRQQAQAARLAAPLSTPTSFQAVAKVTVKAEF